MSVPDLLRQSLAEHERAKALRRSGDKVTAKVALTAARDLRLEAIAEDSTFADEAWASERVPNADMLAFYATMLS